MNALAQLPFLLSLIASSVMCGAWWYAAMKKRGVAIFYWLAAAHTFSLCVSILQVYYMLTEAGRARVIEKLEAMQMRYDEAKNLVEAGDPRARDALKKLDEARADAWDALDKAPRVDRSS